MRVKADRLYLFVTINQPLIRWSSDLLAEMVQPWMETSGIFSSLVIGLSMRGHCSRNLLIDAILDFHS